MGSTIGSDSWELILDNDANDIGELVRRRRIGDKHTWVLDLDIRGSDAPEVPPDVLEVTTFRLRIPERVDQDLNIAHYEIDFDEHIRHSVLRHRYVTLADDDRDGEDIVIFDDNNRRVRTSYYGRNCEELQERLNELTMIELTKLPANDCPSALCKSGHVWPRRSESDLRCHRL